MILPRTLNIGVVLLDALLKGRSSLLGRHALCYRSRISHFLDYAQPIDTPSKALTEEFVISRGKKRPFKYHCMFCENLICFVSLRS